MIDHSKGFIDPGFEDALQALLGLGPLIIDQRKDPLNILPELGLALFDGKALHFPGFRVKVLIALEGAEETEERHQNDDKKADLYGKIADGWFIHILFPIRARSRSPGRPLKPFVLFTMERQ
jgi:hypothetical protein